MGMFFRCLCTDHCTGKLEVAKDETYAGVKMVKLKIYQPGFGKAASVFYIDKTQLEFLIDQLQVYAEELNAVSNA